MRGLMGLAAAGLAGTLTFSACSDSERPAKADPSCDPNDPTCNTSWNPPGGEGSGLEAGADTGGGTVEAGAEITLTGRVLVYEGDDFYATRFFTEDAEVFADAPAGGLVRAQIYGDEFVLEGALASDPVWVGVEPAAGGTDLITTLHPFDTTLGLPLELKVVSGFTLDEILTGLMRPTTRDTTAAQILLIFFDETGWTIPDVTVVASQSDQRIAYRIATVWTDDAAATDDEGLALVINVPAPDLPGSYVPITYEMPGASLPPVWVRAARGAVTVAPVPVAP